MTPEPLRVPADNPGLMTGDGNNTWFLDGAVPTLIDAGTGNPSHVASLMRALAGRSLNRVLVTHGHPDHASGMTTLKASWPTLEASKFLLHGETGWTPLRDGQRVRAGDRELTVVHTPGHAEDHVCFWDAERRWLFGGDMLLGHTTVMIPAGRGGSLRLYLASLARVRALAPVRIYPGHGETLDNPDALIATHIEHRLLRERQILAALDAGVTDVDAIVTRIYPGLAAGLRHAATLTVEAHLEKLREEGQLERR